MNVFFYGVMMTITFGEAKVLYADDSVADYAPEAVNVVLVGGHQVEADCYNLPADRVTGTNKDYAKSLLAMAKRLDFPDSYLDQIRRAGT